MLRSWISHTQQQVSNPRRLALHCIFPRKTRWLSHVPGHSWSNISVCGTVSFSMHTPSPLHFTYQALNFSVPCTSPVCQPGIRRKPSAVLSLSLPLLLPPSLSTGVTESYVKSGRSYYAKNFTRRVRPLYSSITYL